VCSSDLFFEAYEGLTSMSSIDAINPLKYMLLSKIMVGALDDVPSILASKPGLKHAGRHMEAMRSLANSYKERSLLSFERTLEEYAAELLQDPIISIHVKYLNELLLESNLLKITEPYETVYISHIAKKIGLPVDRVEQALSHMILDKKLLGSLDAGQGILGIYKNLQHATKYESAIGIIENLSLVVDTLQKRAEKLK
jgi:26S proteasome regulatory subunit N6